MKTLLKILALAILGVALLIGLVVTFRAGPGPVIEILPEVPAIGTRTPVVVTAVAVACRLLPAACCQRSRRSPTTLCGKQERLAALQIGAELGGRSSAVCRGRCWSWWRWC